MTTFALSWPTGFNAPISKEVGVGAMKVYDTNVIYFRIIWNCKLQGERWKYMTY